MDTKRPPRSDMSNAVCWLRQHDFVAECVQKTVDRYTLPLRLARTQSHRHPRRRVLRHTLCVAPGLVGALDAAGILGALSPQAHGASGATALSGAAIVALRTCAHGVKPPSVLV